MRRRRRAPSSRPGSWSRPPSSRMSTSMPDSRVNPSPLMPATTSSCARSRSGDRPFATRRRGEWSVSARYSCPSARAASTIRSIDVSPSDQSLWECRSPRSSPRRVDDRSHARPLPQVCEVRRHLTRQRLLDHRERRIADALAATQGRGIPQLLVAQALDRVGRGAECLRLVPRRSLALEKSRDLGQRVMRIHVRDARPAGASRAGEARSLHDDRDGGQPVDRPSEQDREHTHRRRRTARRRRRRPT